MPNLSSILLINFCTFPSAGGVATSVTTGGLAGLGVTGGVVGVAGGTGCL